MATITHAFHWKRLGRIFAVPAWLLIGWGLIESLHTLGYIGDHLNWLATPKGNLFVILFGFVWLFAVALWPSHARPESEREDVNDAAQKTPNWCDEMAEDDVRLMRMRVTDVKWEPEPHYMAPEPYIDFNVTFVNATVFNLTAQKIEGATYFGTDPLARPPQITLPSPSNFQLPHGLKASVRIRQHFSPEVAQKVRTQLGHVSLDFSRASITFSTEGAGRPPGQFVWHGTRDITVEDRQRAGEVPESPKITVLATPLSYSDVKPPLGYPLKMHVEMRNDCSDCIDVRLSEYRPNIAQLKGFPLDVLQVKYSGTYTGKGEQRIAVLPQQMFNAWLGLDESKFTKEQLEPLRGKIGTLVLTVNGQTVDISV